MNSTGRIISLTLVLAVAAACDTTTPIEPGPLPVSDTLSVVGHGTINARYTAEIAVRGPWAYTSTWGNRGAPGNAVFVWNVAGAAPVLTDSVIVSGANTTGDVQISDDGALLVVAKEFAPGAIVLYDLTNPSRPALLSTFATANTTQGVHTVKLGRVAGRHYAFLSIDPGTEPARLVVADITDPLAPVEVLARAMGQPFVHDVFVRDGLLFTALWHEGVTIWDIGGGGRGGTPSNPIQISNFRPASGSIHNVWWFQDPTTNSKRYLFLGEEGPGSVGTGTASGEIHVLDISDLTQPRQVAVYGVPGAGTHNFWMDEQSGVLYAAFYNAGVRALDVRGDLGTCSATEKRVSSGFCDLKAMNREVGVAVVGGTFIWGVVHQGSHVYASDMLSGIYKIDAASLQR